MDEPKPIIIQDFTKGIGPSPFVDGGLTAGFFSDMRNIDGQTRPGSARLNPQLQATTFTTYYGHPTLTATGSSFTNASSTVTVNQDFLVTGRQVITSAQSGGAVSNGATYFVIYINSTTIKLATTLANALAGTALTFGATGTATLTTIDMGKPKYMVYDPNGLTYYMQDSNGRIWQSPSGSLDSWTLLIGNTISPNSNGNGLVLFNNYLLVFMDFTIEVYGDLTSSPAWHTSWQSILGTTVMDHVPYYSPINGLVYWAEYRDGTSLGATSIPIGSSGLGSLLQTKGTIFLFSDASTFTFTSAYAANLFALSLPTYHKITAMVLLADQLMIGTNQDFIYPWDTYSSTYSLPLKTTEINITAMINDGNTLYYACGNRGNIYIYNGYYSQFFKQVPPYLTNFPFATGTNRPVISAMVKHNGKLFFALICKGCSGLWSVNLQTGAMVLENSISDGSYGVASAIDMGALLSVGNEQIFVGWSDIDAGTHGLDIQGLNAVNFYYQTGYTSYFETQFYNIGVARTPRNLANFDITLGATLSAGQGIKIYSRANLSDSYSATPDVTFDFATYGAVDNLQFAYGKSWVNVQFKVVKTTGANSSTTPQLNSIIIL